MNQLIKLFPYIIIAFVVMAIIFAVTRPNDNTILTTIKDKNKAKIEDNKLKEDSLIKVIEIKDNYIDSLEKNNKNTEKILNTKIIYNEKKYNYILNISGDSSLQLFHANYSR